MNEGPDYGATRKRAASVSYADIEAAARRLMTTGGYPSVAAVRKELKRGSTTTISDAMQRFWKDQAALNGGNLNALTRLPPDFANAAADLWEQALALAQQAAKSDDNVARSRLKEIESENQLRAHSLELREKEWEAAARERERALVDAREHLLLLSKSLGRDQATLQARDERIADLEVQIAQYRQQIAGLIASAITRQRRAPRRAALKSTHVLSKPDLKAGRTKKPGARRKAASKPQSVSRHRSRHPNSSRRKR